MNENIGFGARYFNFFMAGNDIIDRTDLTTQEKLLCLVVARFSNNGQTAYPSYQTLAERCSFSKSTAIRTVKSLVAKGVLFKQERKDGAENESNVYFLRDNLTNNVISQEGGSVRLTPGVVSERHPKNNKLKNMYGAVSQAPKKDSDFSLGDTEKPYKKKTAKLKPVAADSPYAIIIDYFNSKRGNKFKASNVEFKSNIDELLNTYSLEEIKDVIDYVYTDNFVEKWWSPKTVFRVSNFERSYEFMAKKKGCANAQPESKKTYYYVVNINTNEVNALPFKPAIDEARIYLSREEAEASIKKRV